MADLSWAGPLLPLLVGVLALLGVLGAATVTSYSQWRAAKLQSRELAYAQVMGHRFLITQLYVSRFEARIHSDYHERRWTLQKSPAVSMDLTEARRWMQQSEDLAIEIARAQKDLFESIGLAKASFRRADELDSLTNRVFHFRTPQITDPPADMTVEELDTWKTTAVGQLQKVVEDEFAKPIDSLLDYLLQHVDD